MVKVELGQTECEGCGKTASIKRRSNGKKLLYLHCSGCGLDQRSGANLQAKWQDAISGISSAGVTAATPDNTSTLSDNKSEWEPNQKQIEVVENDRQAEQEGTSGTENRTLIGFGCVFLAIIGFGAFAR